MSKRGRPFDRRERRHRLTQRRARREQAWADTFTHGTHYTDGRVEWWAERVQFRRTTAGCLIENTLWKTPVMAGKWFSPKELRWNRTRG